MSGAGAVPRLLFAAAAAVAAVILLILAHPLSFFLDEWDFLLDRREWTASVFLDPHNEHITILPVAVYKLLVTAFGMDSQAPFQVVLTACVVVNATLVFTWTRRRVGDWLALAAGVPLLFLGSSAIDLLWPFQITLMGSMAFGLGALLALDRGDRRADRFACGLLVASVATHSPGVAFSVGAAAAILAGPGRRERAYVFLIPLGFYVVWWLGWGVGPEAGGITPERAIHAPVYVYNGFASATASLLGLVIGVGGDPIDPLRWGRPLLAIAIAVGAWRLWRLRTVTPALAAALGTALVFWTLPALVGGSDREPTNGRYQYLGAVFLILIAAELWRGARPGRAGVAVALGVSVLALIGNLRAFSDPRNNLRIGSEAGRGALAAAEIAGPLADPATELTLGATAGPYLEAVDEYGSPAFDSDELAAADEFVRVTADSTFGRLYGLATTTASGQAPGRCVTVSPAAPSTVTADPGPLTISARDQAALSLRRYARSSFPVDLGTVARGSRAAVRIPADGSDVPWTLAITSAKPARVCRAAAGG